MRQHPHTWQGGCEQTAPTFPTLLQPSESLRRRVHRVHTFLLAPRAATSLADYVATGSLQATHVAEMRCALEETSPVRRVSHSARLGSQLGRSGSGGGGGGATLSGTPGGGGARGKATARSRGVLEVRLTCP